MPGRLSLLLGRDFHNRLLTEISHKKRELKMGNGKQKLVNSHMGHPAVELSPEKVRPRKVPNARDSKPARKGFVQRVVQSVLLCCATLGMHRDGADAVEVKEPPVLSTERVPAVDLMVSDVQKPRDVKDMCATCGSTSLVIECAGRDNITCASCFGGTRPQENMSF